MYVRSALVDELLTRVLIRLYVEQLTLYIGAVIGLPIVVSWGSSGCCTEQYCCTQALRT